MKINKLWRYCFLVFFSLVPIIFISLPVWLSIASIFIFIIISYKYNLKKFPLILFMLAFLIRIIFNLIVNTPIESDFLVLYKASKQLLMGDLSFYNMRYFQLWAYQIGFVGYQTLLLKIWDSVFFLKIVNCLISALICLLVYLIAKMLVKDKYAKIVSLIYTFLPFTITYTSVLTNQHMATLLIYLALYLLINENIKIKTIFKYMIVGILIAISNLIRPEGIITITALIISLILEIKKKNYKSIMTSLVILLLFYYGTFTLTSHILVKRGIAPYGVKNNAPYWKFLLGFNQESLGKYNANDGYLLENPTEAKEVIKDRILIMPTKIIYLFDNKIRTFWNSTSLSWSLNHLAKEEYLGFKMSDIINILEKENSFTIFILYFLIVIGIFKNRNNNKLNFKTNIFMNQIFVTLGVYLLIEVQPRYAYFIEVSIAILGALGIEYLLDFYFKNKKEIKKIFLPKVSIINEK